MSGLNVSRMTAEIVLQTAAATVSDSGESGFDWDHARSLALFAQWLPGGTTEAWRAQQRLASTVTGVFRIHDLADRPSPENTRILYQGQVYDTKPYVEIGDGGMCVGLDIPVVAHGEA